MRECEGAKVFFDRLEELDKIVAEKLNHQHETDMRNRNFSLAKPLPYQVGDWVLVLRHKGGGTKLDTWWVGPACVVRRTGDLSY